MINYIKGTLADINNDGAVVEAGGIGYEVLMPVSALEALPRVGSEVKIFTYMHVREDLLQLFGFMSKEDLRVFRLLITVNGVGPKGALGMLGMMSADDIKFAVLAGDAKAMSKAPGVGIKTAGKIILELKDKMGMEVDVGGEGRGTAKAGSDKDSQMAADAREALVALGYMPADAARAVRGVESGSYSSVEELLKLSLKNL